MEFQLFSVGIFVMNRFYKSFYECKHFEDANLYKIKYELKGH